MSPSPIEGRRSFRPLHLAAGMLGLFAFAPALLVAQNAQLRKVENPGKLFPIEVHPYGRTQLGADGMYVYQWPGVYFLAPFKGPEVFFKIGPGKQNLRIAVDGQTLPPLLNEAPGVYRVSAPSGGSHLLRIETANENQDGPKTLGGFSAPAAERAMEFIGDSYTVGYGNISPSRECSPDQVWSRTDTTQSFGADVAQHYGANYEINAISGRGVVRNFPGAPSEPLPAEYPLPLFDKPGNNDVQEWRPAVIVIGLGTNDFITPLRADEPWKTKDELHSAFEEAYAGFLKNLRLRNPAALIVLWATDGLDGETASEGRKVVEQAHRFGDRRVDFVEVGGLAFTGCQWHPSSADDRIIAGKVIADIDTHSDVWP